MHQGSINQDIPANRDDMIAFDPEERELLSSALESLRKRGADEAEVLRRRIEDLENLAAAISRFPPVGAAQLLSGVKRGPETLTTVILNVSGPARLLHTPTRVVAARSFFVAKTHAFSLAALATSYDRDLSMRFRAAIFAVVFSLMAEDVYLSCLDDRDFPASKKESLAADLVCLWESGRDPRATSHVPALRALWAAREAAPPVFGTMEGSSELMRLSLDLGSDWLSFVTARMGDDETVCALEEFLFGLSCEEIAETRARLRRLCIGAVNREEVHSFLGRDSTYGPIAEGDPRTMYEFYVERREAARARALSCAPGPRRTLEELYLAYRMAREC
jgi:hypothetical protein